jgi:site-specific recombinase XerD
VGSNKGKKFDVEVLTTDEVARVLQTFPPTNTGLRNRTMALIMYRTAIRCAELTALRPRDINEPAGTITIVRGKGGKRRVVGASPEVFVEIAKWTKVRPNGETLFCTWVGNHMDTSSVRRTMKAAGIKAGLSKRVHPHQARHSAAFHFINSGVDIRIVQRQLGHSSIAVTDRYVNHLGDPAVVQAVQSVRW